MLGPDEPRPDLTIVVANDDGGTIFATLEQGPRSTPASYDRLFGTPHGIDLAALCAATRRRTGGSTAAPSSSTPSPARTAGSRSSRPASGATTGASSTPRSGRWRTDRHRGRMRRAPRRWLLHIALWLVGLVATVVVVTGVCSKLDVPAPLLLVVVGVVGSYVPCVPEVEPRAEVVLFGLLPPLLYSAALQTSLVDFNVNRRPILLLSVGPGRLHDRRCRGGRARAAARPRLAAGLRDRGRRGAAGRGRGHRDRSPDRPAAADRHDSRGRVAAQRRHRPGRAGHRDRGDRGGCGLAASASTS